MPFALYDMGGDMAESMFAVVFLQSFDGLCSSYRVVFARDEEDGQVASYLLKKLVARHLQQVLIHILISSGREAKSAKWISREPIYVLFVYTQPCVLSFVSEAEEERKRTKGRKRFGLGMSSANGARELGSIIGEPCFCR